MPPLRLFLTLLAAALLSTTAAALDVPSPVQDVWPQSPQARRIQEVTMPSPAMATGACEFSVPLYTVSCEAVELPFALSYRSNGIRLDDDPHPIGYGWTLTPALRISRQIKGRPDEYFQFIGDQDSRTVEANHDMCFEAVTMKYAESKADIDSIRRLDPERDIFTVSLPGVSLQLVYDGTRFHGPLCDEYCITPYGRLDSITVTDPKGIRWCFSIEGEKLNNEINRTEWLLGSIVLPSGRRISLEWIGQKHQCHGLSSFGGKTLRYSRTPPTFMIEEGEPEAGPLQRHFEYFGTRDISAVIFPCGRLEIEYSAEAMINSMTVRAGGITVWSACFAHEGRRLASVDISGTGEYSFDYDRQTFVSGGAADWWGFHNGKANDSNLAPTVRVNPGKYSHFPNGDIFYGADRSVDTVMMKANILTSATFPTGGKVEWEYEPHHFVRTECTDTFATNRIDEITLEYGGGLRVRAIKLYESPTDPLPRVRRYRYGRDGDGLAEVTALPFLHTFMQETFIVQLRPNGIGGYYVHPDDRYLTVGTFSDCMTGHDGRPQIWYSEVEELEEEGKTVHRYSQLTDPAVVERDWGRIVAVSVPAAFSKGPVEVAKEVYRTASGDYELVEETTNIYNLVRCHSMLGTGFLNIRRKNVEVDYSDFRPDFGPSWYSFEADFPSWVYGCFPGLSGGTVRVVYNINEFQWYEVRNGYTVMQTEQLVGTTTQEYTPTGTICRTTKTEYLPGTSLPTRAVLTDGHTEIVTEYAYAEAQPELMRKAMEATNAIGIPTEVIETCGTASESYKLDMACIEAAVFRPRKVVTTSDGTSRSLATYFYDRFGNPVEAIGIDGRTIEWEWDSDGLHPVKLTECGRLVSTAEWLPLVGVTKLTAPGAPRLDFAYDDAGRLISTSEGTHLTATYAYEITQGATSVTSTAYAIDGASPSSTVTSHYDGLGRLWAEETDDGSPRTIVTRYDAMGRPWRTSATVPGCGATDALSIESAAASYYATGNAFRTTAYEPSPRALATAVTNSGEGWDAHPATKTRYANDNSTYSCPKFSVSSSGMRRTGLWPAGSLTVEVATDEDGHSVETYTDLRGLTVMSRRGGLSTCFVHDGHGRLVAVLPPGLSDKSSASASDVAALAYLYCYDPYGRLVSKKLPGAEEVRYYYDPADRLVAERNAAFVRGWRVYGYDWADRPAFTAEASLTEPKAEALAVSCMTATLDGGPMAGYSLPGLSENDAEAATVTYYDDYAFVGLLSLDERFSPAGTPTLGAGFSDIDIPPCMATCLGKPSGAFTGAGHELYQYDGNWRMALRIATGYNEGITVFNYTPAGLPLNTVHRHFSGTALSGRGLAVETEYDSAGRPTASKVRQERNSFALGGLSQSETQVQSAEPDAVAPIYSYDRASVTTAYDELGRPYLTTLGDKASATTAYDIHGWVTGRKLTCGLAKLVTESYAHAQLYNGDISAKTTTNGTYSYTYDGLDRLVDASFSPNERVGGIDRSASFEYDDRGNPTTIVRKGFKMKFEIAGSSGNLSGTVVPSDPSDDIAKWSFVGYRTRDYMYDITYNGNQISRIVTSNPKLSTESQPSTAEFSAEVEYDAAGRVIADASRGITSIEYNSDSHPTKIQFKEGHYQELTWDNLGNHISTKYHTNNVASLIQPKALSIADIDDLGGKKRPYTESVRRYYGSGQIAVDDSLVMTRFPGGYLTGDGKARYYFADYQGNNLATVDAEGNIVESTGYYPYGQPWEEPKENNYLYGDKEYDNVHGLGEYYYGARQSVPFLAGGFTTPDALCEKRQWESPYILCGENPIRNIDQDGNEFNIIIGGLIGGALGAAVEIMSQIGSEDFSWEAVGGAALQGTITGAVAGATCGLSLLYSAGSMGAANAAGGVVNDLIQGNEPTIESVSSDAVLGAVSASIGQAAKQITECALNNMSNAVKGSLGEFVTKVKYVFKGYSNEGKAVYYTGAKTPITKTDAKAIYDFRFTKNGIEIIVDAKYNTSRLTQNQKLAEKFNKLNIIVDRTTSEDFAKVMQILISAGLCNTPTN